MLDVLFALLARGKGTITKSAKRVEKNEFLICLKIKKIMGFPSALYSKKKVLSIVITLFFMECISLQSLFHVYVGFFCMNICLLCKGDLSYQMLFLFHLKRSVWIKHIHFYYKQIWITIFNSKSYISQKLASFYVQLMKNNAYILLDIYNYNCIIKTFNKENFTLWKKKSFMPSNILKIDKTMDLFSLGDDEK